MGALARYVAQRMLSSIGSGFGGNTVISGLPDGFSGTDFLLGQMNPGFQQAAQNNPVSIMGSFLIGLGLVLVVAGIVLAVALYRYGHRRKSTE